MRLFTWMPYPAPRYSGRNNLRSSAQSEITIRRREPSVRTARPMPPGGGGPGRRAGGSVRAGRGGRDGRPWPGAAGPRSRRRGGGARTRRPRRAGEAGSAGRRHEGKRRGPRWSHRRKDGEGGLEAVQGGAAYFLLFAPRKAVTTTTRGGGSFGSGRLVMPSRTPAISSYMRMDSALWCLPKFFESVPPWAM